MHVLNAFLSATIVAATTVSAAMAVTSDKFVYDKPQTRVYSISPEELTPSDSDVSFSRNGFELKSSSPGRVCYSSGLHLPDGATVTKLTVRAQSIVGLESTLAIVARTTPASDAPVARIDFIVGGIVELEDDDLTNALIDNSQFVYRFTVCLEQNERFFHARVTYKFKSAGD